MQANDLNRVKSAKQKRDAADLLTMSRDKRQRAKAAWEAQRFTVENFWDQQLRGAEKDEVRKMVEPRFNDGT